MNRDELVHYLSELLAVAEFNDACLNGLQVEGRKEIQKIVCGVSISDRLFKAAVDKKADMILVHHGLFWKRDTNPMTITGIRRNRLALLLKNDINLIAYHLPLDAHGEFGNNIQLLNRLQIPAVESFEVGFIGSPADSLSVSDLCKRIDASLETSSVLFDFGPQEVKQLLVISGSGSLLAENAKQIGIDTFIGGDIKEDHVRVFEELQLNYIAAGHYNSEKLGVQALCDHLTDKFGLRTEFVDVPNPV